MERFTPSFSPAYVSTAAIAALPKKPDRKIGSENRPFILALTPPNKLSNAASIATAIYGVNVPGNSYGTRNPISTPARSPIQTITMPASSFFARSGCVFHLGGAHISGNGDTPFFFDFDLNAPLPEHFHRALLLQQRALKHIA